MTELVVRPAAEGASMRALSVEAGGDLVAMAAVARRRLDLVDTGPDRSDARSGAAVPDPAAWGPDAASRAAHARWSDHHPAIRTVSALTTTDGRFRPAEVIEAIGDHLAQEGVRRLDVRMPAGHVLDGALEGTRWVQGRAGDAVVASLAVAYPWTGAPAPDGRLASLLAPFPPRVRRAARRVAAVRPGQIPELVRSVGTETLAAVRQRSAPGTRSVPVDGAPEGAHPFAASRYRAIRSALALVPDGLRRTHLLDVGCGDGRVLREALDAGFPHVHGRELDPELAERAREAVGAAGSVEAGDALAVPVPDQVGVVFLNNPFDAPLVARFAGLLHASLERQPRPLLVLYLNPRTIDPLLDAGLVLVHVDPRFTVLATAARQ